MTDGPDLFPGFRSRVIETPGARIRVRVGGSGPLVVLLHGYPQTGAMWHRIAAGLATRHTVAVPDLRGYGASECLDDDFSFRAMAADVAALIGELGGVGPVRQATGNATGPTTTPLSSSDTTGVPGPRIGWCSIGPGWCGAWRCSTSCPPPRCGGRCHRR